MTERITERLFALQDSAYAEFQHKLTPGLDRARFIGVRVPLARRLAGDLAGEPETEAFLRTLPHRYFDEDMLHGILLSGMQDYAACLEAVEAFLPYVETGRCATSCRRRCSGRTDRSCWAKPRHGCARTGPTPSASAWKCG